MAKMRSKKMEFEVGSGNVFADLGFPDASVLDIKVRLINARRLSQVAAAKFLKINQPKISALKNYKIDGFSVERLMNFLLVLGQDVEIRIKPNEGRKILGKIQVAMRSSLALKGSGQTDTRQVSSIIDNRRKESRVRAEIINRAQKLSGLLDVGQQVCEIPTSVRRGFWYPFAKEVGSGGFVRALQLTLDSGRHALVARHPVPNFVAQREPPACKHVSIASVLAIPLNGRRVILRYGSPALEYGKQPLAGLMPH
jgi:predicted XRE-type DNA-binding protein